MIRRRVFWLVVPVALWLGALAFGLLGFGQPASADSVNATFPTIADFEDGAPPDWFVYNGGASTVSTEFLIIADSDPLALPGQVGDNGILSGTFSIGDFGGFGAGLIPAQDWSDFQAISFDFWGTDSGLTYIIEVQDGTGDVVERFHGLFVDDTAGWKRVVIPFDNFVRGGFQDVGAPNDGFQLTEIVNWVFPLPFGSDMMLLDNLAVTNLDPFADYDAGAPAGWFVYNGGAASVSTEFLTISDTDSLALPGQIGDNGILSGTYSIGDFGGFGAGFEPAEDWSELDGLSYWFYGSNSGATYTFEIQDGTPGNPVVERFVHTFVDDFTGWQYIVAPWADFVRGGFQEPGAPDDGLNLIDVRAWAYPLPLGDGAFKIDAMSVFGNQGDIPVKVSLNASNYGVVEGNSVTVTAVLNIVAADTVTVTLATADDTALAGDDYVATTTDLVIPAGETAAAVAIATIDDEEQEDAETFTVNLSDPQGAELGTIASATVTIAKSDQPVLVGKTVIVDDFEQDDLPEGEDPNGISVGYVTFNHPDASAAITITTDAPAPVPGAPAGNRVLAEELTIGSGQWAGYTHAFTNEAADTWVSQDWSSYEGLSLWLYGNNTGGILFIDVLDNRNPGSTSDDAERFSIDIVDDFSGWQQFEIPFADFNRKDIGNGAPDDGFTLTEVHGYAVGGFGSVDMGTNTYYVDNVGLIVRVDIVDDFEDGELPLGTDGDGNEIGWPTFSDGSPIAITTTTTADAVIDPVPGTTDDNIVIDMTGDVSVFAGFIHAFEDEALTTWVTQDWSSYEGVCFWFYGDGDGNELFIDILDNRNPGSTSDDAERFTTVFTDDTAGWQFIQVPFDEFTRKEIGNGAPNDGLTLTQMHGWALGTLSTDGEETHYLDDFAVYGNAGEGSNEVTVQFGQSNFEVTEGGTASVVVQLNMTSTVPITVSYASAEAAAKPDREYIPVSGELVFAPGEDEATFTLETFDDNKHENDERIVLVLSDPLSATLGFQYRTVVTMLDDDPRDPFLIDDFQIGNPFTIDGGNVTLNRALIIEGSPFELPIQVGEETVLRGWFETPWVDAVIRRGFSEGKDWSNASELNFWFYGTNNGRQVALELRDNQAPDPGPSGWELVWSDEFNEAAGAQPDPDIWSYEIGDGTLNGIPGWGNSELQYYTDDPENVSMDGQGNLVITAREADGSLACWYGPCEYTSARIITKNKVDFQYGRIEARILVPSGGDGIPDGDGNDLGDGLWPAFWTLGDDIDEVGWPQTGEIDIMEVVSREPYEVFGTIHGPGYSGGASFGDIYTFDDPVSDDYHTFAIEWEPGIIRWYVDDIMYHTAIPDDVAPNEWVFEHPFFLLLNLAIGGNFGGPVGDDTGFPQSMLIDYVRVYQAPDSAERFEANFTNDFYGWQQVSVPFTDFVRSPDQPANAPDDGLTLTEVWGYGFKAPSYVATQAVPAAPIFQAAIDQVRVVCGNQQVTVTSTANDGPGSLREALTSVCDGGTITFDVPADSTITLSSELTVAKNVTIDGAGAPGLVLSGDGAVRVIVVDGGVVATIANLAITDGYGFDLAGGVLNNGTLTLDNVVVANNLADANAPDFWKGGGGIYNGDGAVLNLTGSTVRDNTSNVVDGAGIYGFFNSTINIDNSTISGNVAGGVGGGIRSLGDVYVMNSTFSGNVAQAWHGGAVFHTDGGFEIAYSSVVSNTAPDGFVGGMLVATFGDASPTLTLEGTIVAYNSGAQCGVEDQGGGTPALGSVGYNLASDGSCDPTGDGDQADTDPLLGPLQNNGGPTETHLPAAGSPAIDAGGTGCPAADQRGIARPQGAACDAGSVEVVTSQPKLAVDLK